MYRQWSLQIIYTKKWNSYLGIIVISKEVQNKVSIDIYLNWLNWFHLFSREVYSFLW